jgi:hypothetical protein
VAIRLRVAKAFGAGIIPAMPTWIMCERRCLEDFAFSLKKMRSKNMI